MSDAVIFPVSCSPSIFWDHMIYCVASKFLRKPLEIIPIAVRIYITTLLLCNVKMNRLIKPNLILHVDLFNWKVIVIIASQFRGPVPGKEGNYAAEAINPDSAINPGSVINPDFAIVNRFSRRGHMQRQCCSYRLII